MTLSREEIFAARKDRKPVELVVPEWGGSVFVKHLTVADQVELQNHTQPAEMPIAVLIACLVDENEEPIFSLSDTEELSKEAFPVVLKVFGFVAKLNGLSNAELEEAMSNLGAIPPSTTESDSLSQQGEPISEMSAPSS
jgi:hypothetical protein